AGPPQAGTKMACPGCGQRLQVPAPPQNKTILGELTPASGPLDNAFAAGSPSPVPAPEPGPMWYYAQGGQRNGPVAWTQLRQLASGGILDGQALVWTQGMPSWIPAQSQPNLFSPNPALAGAVHLIAGRAPGSGGSKALMYGGLGLGLICCGLLAVLF